MKDEIKEILEYIKDVDLYIEDNGYQYKRLSLIEIKILLDYITNLQEENENKTEYICDLVTEKINYKQRNEKAIEYIKNNCYYLVDNDDKNLLNILQNGGDI